MEIVRIEQIEYQQTWQLRHEVMYPDLPFDQIKLANDADGTHFGLIADGQLTSVVSLFNIADSYQFRKFATSTRLQGAGYGSALLKYLITYIQERAAAQLWCNARVSASGFYERFGFVKSGPVYIENNIEFVRMELNSQNPAKIFYFEKIKIN